MKFYDTDTHEIFEATRDEYKKYMELYHEDMLLTGVASHIFVPICPPLRGHRHFVYKFDEEYAMIKFEDKFVHFRWSDELTDKNVFYADSLDMLEFNFRCSQDSRGCVRSSHREDFPFRIAGDANFRFVYYDPNYDCKVAFNEGQKIQGRRLPTNPWMDIDAPAWDYEYEYRIKPKEGVYAVVIVSGKLSYIPVEQITCQHVFFRGSQDECHNYIVSHKKFTKCMVAYLDNKKIQWRRTEGRIWEDTDEPCWTTYCEYRIKPGLVWSDLHIGDVVRQFNGSIISSVTAFDMAEDVNAHVQIAGWGWVGDTELAEDWFKV